MARGRRNGFSESREPRTEPVLPTREPPSDIPELHHDDESVRKGMRIEWITERMRNNEWPAWPESLKYRQRLAERWGVSESTIRGYSAESHRVLELDPVDRAMMALDVAREMDAIKVDALGTVNEQTGLPDYPSAIKALEAKAKYLGVEPPKEVKLSGGVSLASIDELRKALGDDEGEGS